ncbi:MAG: hypothetical protein IJK71_08540 [Clostridia bacterium]|nr:hypothetical protein [Clostridia bacterium]
MLDELFSAISQKMRVDFEKVTKQILHNGERGTARETILQEYLETYIPKKYAFAKGMIINAMNECSKQIDIIIHDSIITPYLFDIGTTMIPIETVYATIEVKSRLTKDELEKAIKNIESVRKLQKRTINGISYSTAGYIFAYDSDSSLETIYKNYIELSKDIPISHQVSCICVLGKGLILPVMKDGLLTISTFPGENTLYAIFNDPENSLLMFYLLLFHTLNEIQVYPPNMIEYAQSTGKLNTSLFIPSGYMPDDAVYRFMGHSLSMKDVNSIQEWRQKFFSGNLKRDEMLQCEFGMMIPMLNSQYGTLENVPKDCKFTFMDIPLDFEIFKKHYFIYQKGNEATPQEKSDLQKYGDFLFAIYAENQEKIKQTNQSKES